VLEEREDRLTRVQVLCEKTANAIEPEKGVTFLKGHEDNLGEGSSYFLENCIRGNG
jgi:hypothetical protein